MALCSVSSAHPALAEPEVLISSEVAGCGREGASSPWPREFGMCQRKYQLLQRGAHGQPRAVRPGQE